MLDWYRHQVALRLDAGYPLAEVERALIDTAADLSDEERSALWLFAWSYRPGARPVRLSWRNPEPSPRDDRPPVIGGAGPVR
jgi:hypothetical protein